MKESIEPWQAPIDNQNGNRNLRLNIKILLRFLRLFLIPFAYLLFKKLVNTNRNLARKTAMYCESTNDFCSKTIEPVVKGQEEKISETETKVTTDNNLCAKSLEMAIKHKTSAIQHKKETPKKLLTTMNLTNMEPVTPKNDQEWQIIIDFHDIGEFTQHHGMDQTGETDIFRWPSIIELRQQQEKMKNSPSEEGCESLYSYIHYTDHIRLEKVNTYSQELQQLVGDSCKLIETEHQIIIKILMVKDVISNDKGSRLNCKDANITKKEELLQCCNVENVKNDSNDPCKDDVEHHSKDELEFANDGSMECYSKDDTKCPGKSYEECPSKDHAEYPDESHGEMALLYYCCVCSLIYTLTFLHKLLYL